MRLLIPTVIPITGQLNVANATDDLILNSALLGFKRSRLRMKGAIVSPMAGRVIAIVKSRRLLGFQAQNGKVYWWRLGLIWPTCPVVPFDLMVKVGDRVTVGQPLAVMVNAWGQPQVVAMMVTAKLHQALALIRAELFVSLKLIRHVEVVGAQSVLSLAGNHQVKIVGPPFSRVLNRQWLRMVS